MSSYDAWKLDSPAEHPRNDEIAAAKCDIDITARLLSEVTTGDVTLYIPQWRLNELSDDPDDPIRFNLSLEGVALEPWAPAAEQIAAMFKQWANELLVAHAKGGA